MLAFPAGTRLDTTRKSSFSVERHFCNGLLANRFRFEAFLLYGDEFLDEFRVGVISFERVCVEEIVEDAANDDVGRGGILHERLEIVHRVVVVAFAE